MSSTASAVLLGSSVEDPKLASEFLSLLFVPQFLFAGFFVTPSLIPSWLRWLRYLCTLTYSIRIGLVGEFESCGPPGEQASLNCEQVLQDNDADPDETWWNWLALVAFFAFFRVYALYVLRKKASKFY